MQQSFIIYQLKAMYNCDILKNGVKAPIFEYSKLECV